MQPTVGGETQVALWRGVAQQAVLSQSESKMALQRTVRRHNMFVPNHPALNALAAREVIRGASIATTRRCGWRVVELVVPPEYC